MSNIGQFLEHIKHARFGKDVRQSFVDCIEEIDRVADTAQDSATASAAAAAESAASIAGVAERVKKSENNAAASERAAAKSETNASTSEQASKVSEQAAAESEVNAAASEQASKVSEQAAAESEVNAAASERAAAKSETNASTSEQASKVSEQAAAESEANALNYRDYAQSYALGTNGAVRPGDDTDNASYYYEQVKRISQGLQGTLLPMGTITYAQLTTVTAQAGYMYNISDDFVTDATFNEGAGHAYSAGTNVYLTADGKWDCMAGTAVGGVKGAKEATYRQGLVNLMPENIGALPEDGDSAENTVTFTSTDSTTPTGWSDVAQMQSGEKHSSLFGKISTMIKNVRWLYKMLGVTDISAIGGGTVTGALSILNTDLANHKNSTSAHDWSAITGKPSTYAPSSHNHDSRYYTEGEIDNLFSQKIPVAQNTSDDFGTWHLQTIPTGGKMITGETKTYTFSFGSAYGNLYYSEFDIVLPNFLSEIRNAFIQANAATGLIGAVITSKTTSHIKGFMYSSDNTAHQISLSIIVYGA